MVKYKRTLRGGSPVAQWASTYLPKNYIKISIWLWKPFFARHFFLGIDFQIMSWHEKNKTSKLKTIFFVPCQTLSLFWYYAHNHILYFSAEYTILHVDMLAICRIDKRTRSVVVWRLRIGALFRSTVFSLLFPPKHLPVGKTITSDQWRVIYVCDVYKCHRLMVERGSIITHYYSEK